MNDFPGEAQIWADHHARWSDDVMALLSAIGAAFAALHRARYSAPWRVNAGCDRPKSAR